MEKGTVTIDVNHYNELRDFKKTIEDGKCFVRGLGGGYDVYFTDEIIKSVTSANKQLREQNEQLKGQIIHGVNMDYLAHMSCREFRRWKRKARQGSF